MTFRIPAARRRRRTTRPATRSRFRWASQFDRILDDFTGPFVKLTAEAKAPAGAIKPPR